MTDTSPMEQLDEQVRAFTRDTLEREGVVTAWVLMVGSTRFDEHGNVVYAYDYVTGVDTSPLNALGLDVVCRKQMLNDCGVGGSDDD